MDIRKLTAPGLQSLLRGLPKQGVLKNKDNYMYIDVANEYIDDCYNLIKDSHNIIKPNYFTEETDDIGAHISIIYPDEVKELYNAHNIRTVTFDTGELFHGKIEDKGYYALTVESPIFMKLRMMNKLPTALQYYSHSVPFHITIGIDKDLES